MRILRTYLENALFYGLGNRQFVDVDGAFLTKAVSTIEGLVLQNDI